MAAAKALKPSYTVIRTSLQDAQQVRLLIDASAKSDAEQAAAHRARG